MIPAMNGGGRADTDLSGLSAADAKAYILAHITQIKLNEKETAALEGEAAGWKEKAALARSRADEGLAREAEARVEAVSGKAAVIRGETEALRAQADRMLRQMPGLAARERSIDPDALLGELQILAGHLPGDEADAARETSAAFDELDAEAALAALKAKMTGETV